MFRIFVITLFSISILSCGGKTKSVDKAVKPNTPQVEATQLNVPQLPQADMERLYREATYVDYIFYNLPFSLSQDDKPSIISNLKLISAEPLSSLPKGCKPIGREFFHIEGEIPYEADLYFGEGCFGYVFIKDNKPLYANKISVEGMKFYNNIMNQSGQIRNQAVNGK